VGNAPWFCRQVSAGNYFPAFLTEPDIRARIRLFGLIDQNTSSSWVDTCGGRILVPEGLKRGHLILEPVWWISTFQHCPIVRFRPCSFSAICAFGGSYISDAFSLQVPTKEAWRLLLSYDNGSNPAANMGVDDVRSANRSAVRIPIFVRPLFRSLTYQRSNHYPATLG
jgi:hypothetical protein